MTKTPKKTRFTPNPRPKEERAVKLNEGSAKARRSAARLAAVQVLYQMEYAEMPAKEALRDFINHRIGFEIDGDVFVPADRDLLTAIITGVSDRKTELSELVTAQLSKKDKTDIDPILRAILLAASYELMAHHDIAPAIIISDYMNVTHAFYDDGAPKMINAILDGIAKTVR